MDNDTRPKKRLADPEEFSEIDRIEADRPADAKRTERRASAEPRSRSGETAGTGRPKRTRKRTSVDGNARVEDARSTDGTARAKRKRPADGTARVEATRTTDGRARAKKKRPTDGTASVESARPVDRTTKAEATLSADVTASVETTRPADDVTRAEAKRPADGTPEVRRRRNRIPLPTESTDPVFDQERRDRARRRKKAALRRKRRARKRLMIIAAGAVAFLLILLGIVGIFNSRKASAGKAGKGSDTVVTDASAALMPDESAAESSVAAVQVTPAPVKVTPAYEEIDFTPHSTDATDPSNLFEYTEVAVNGEEVDRDEAAPFLECDFGVGSSYTDVDGIIGFRGNNFRDDPTYGVASITEHTMSIAWSKPTESMESSGHTWSGNGWTGQPLMMKWPRDVKQHMNMYDSAKSNDDLVEVIYASMDGYIYFLDLETGEATRDSKYLGYTFKGAGALDPRGYPILYVGSGYDSQEGSSRVFVISLIDCNVMYTFGNDDGFALRNINYFDSSALVDAETDTLIYPGENGILYLIHLNTQYDAAAGTISISPDKTTKWHYWGTRSSDENFWLGMEDSCCIYKGYFFACDNGGILWCLNLRTLRVEWAQDILDDSNGSPALSIENGHLYLYVSTSFHLGWRSESTATVPIWKIDAETGEVVWHTDYTCYSESGVSGGVQSTPAIGRNNLNDYVYVTVAKTGDEYAGVLTCLDKESGDIVWEHEAVYTWSSPVCVYDANGTGTVIYFAFDGKGYMLDGVTGEVQSEIQLPTASVEASPAVYMSRMVFGTRDCEIYGIDLK